MTNKNSRRALLRGVAVSPLLPLVSVSRPKPTDIRVEDVAFSYEDFRYRTPNKFGGVAVDRATILNVDVHRAHRAAGRSAKGFGSMPLGNVWSFPSRELTYDDTLGAMKDLAERVAEITGGYREYGHPIDLNMALEPDYLQGGRGGIAQR